MANESEDRMRQSNEAVAWVVYTMITARAARARICEQGEWDQMNLLAPSNYTLVRAGITNEAEAESLARRLSGFVAPTVAPGLKRVHGALIKEPEPDSLNYQKSC
jgi:hypothetical protein